MSVSGTTVAGIKWAGLGRVIGQGLTWAITLVVIRLLSPEDYGLAALSAVVVTLLAGIAELGLGAALVQSQATTREDYARVFGATLMFNVLCAAILVSGAGLLAAGFNDERLRPIIQVASLQFLVAAFVTVPEARAYRELQFKRVAAIDLGAALAAGVATLAIAMGGGGPWSLVVGALVGGAVRAASLAAVTEWVSPSFSLRGIGRHLRFGSTVTGSRLAWMIAHQCDTLIAGKFLPENAVGAYAVAANLAKLPMNKLMGIVNQVAFPAVSRLQDDPELARRRIIDGIRLLALLVVPALWGLSATGPEFVGIVLGQKWVASTIPLQVAALAVPFQMLTNVLGTAITGLGRADAELKNTMVSVAVLPPALIGGVVAGGLAGLAIAWALAVVAATLLNTPRSLRVIRISGPELLRAVRGPLVAGVAMLVLVSGLRLLLMEVGEAFRFVLLVVGGAVGFAIVVTLADSRLLVDARRFAGAITRS